MYRFAILLLLFSQGVHATEKEWTYLFYIAGDEREIDPFSRIPIRKLEQIGSDANRWIVAQVDLHLDAQGVAPATEELRRYEILKFPGNFHHKDFSTLEIRSPIRWSGVGEADSSSAENLSEFLRWGIQNYPAKHYAVFILGHSYGWRGIAEDDQVGEGSTKPPGREFYLMSLSDFGSALRANLPNGKPFDFLVLDVCNGASLESAYALRKVARYLVASEIEMPFYSFDYAKTFSRSVSTLEEQLQFLVTDAIQSFSRGGSQAVLEGDHSVVSLSVVNLEKMESIWGPWSSLIGEIGTLEFYRHFLGHTQRLLQDSSFNVDWSEVLLRLSERAFRRSARALARDILSQLGTGKFGEDRRPIVAPDSGWKRVRIDADIDPLVEDDRAVAIAQVAFNYQNPSLIAFDQRFELFREAGQRRVRITIENQTGQLSLLPLLPGGLWADVAVEDRRGNREQHRVLAPQSWFLETEFPENSPFLLRGRTIGAGRYRGFMVNFESIPDLSRPENTQWVNQRWVSGRDYYKTTQFDQAFRWSRLLYSALNSR